LPTSTPTQEDYLKAIWQLIRAHGYARVSDIAERLGVSHASVSRMVRRLHEDNLTTFVPYRGLNLTPAGQRRGRELVHRQVVLDAWLEALGVPEGPARDRTLEGVEHHFGPETMTRIEQLVRYIAAHEAWWQAFRDDATPPATPP